jgi:hypothetical protein
MCCWLLLFLFSEIYLGSPEIFHTFLCLEDCSENCTGKTVECGPSRKICNVPTDEYIREHFVTNKRVARAQYP